MRIIPSLLTGLSFLRAKHSEQEYERKQQLLWSVGYYGAIASNLVALVHRNAATSTHIRSTAAVQRAFTLAT
jgi:hypothetical protein